MTSVPSVASSDFIKSSQYFSVFISKSWLLFLITLAEININNLSNKMTVVTCHEYGRLKTSK